MKCIQSSPRKDFSSTKISETGLSKEKIPENKAQKMESAARDEQYACLSLSGQLLGPTANR